MAGTIALASQRKEGVVRWSRFTATADASDGTFPETTLVALSTWIDGIILAVQVNPGSPAPDDNFDITLVDADGLDRLEGACLNLDTSASVRIPIPSTAVASPDETLTLTITGNATPDAVLDLIIYHTPQVVAGGLSFTAGALDVSDAAALAELQLVANAVHMEDDAHVSTDSGVSVLGVANEALADLVDTDGDYTPLATDLKGRLLISGVTDVEVVGNVAHDAADSGNPVKIGGYASDAYPSAVAVGDRVNSWLTRRGRTAIAASGANLSDGAANYAGLIPDTYDYGVPVATMPHAFNGSTWDRVRNNVDGTALASAARTATTNSADITNYNARGVAVFLDVTAASGTGGLQVRIQYKDPVSGSYMSINLAPTAVTATGFSVYTMYPGISAGGTQGTSGTLSRTFRILVTHGDGSSYTYSVGYSLIV